MQAGRVGIVTFPISEAGTVPLSQLVDIVVQEANEIHLLTGDRGYAYFQGDERVRLQGLRHKEGSGKLSRISNYVQTQLEMAFRMLKVSDQVDTWIFFIGGDTLLIPMLTARLLGKQTILTFAGSNTKTYESQGDELFRQLRMLSRINCFLSQKLLVYSPSLIDDYGLGQFRNKIHIAHRHFVDFQVFRQTKELSDRGMLIGYVGRLSEEKGVQRLVEAMTLLPDQEVELLIVGDGLLRDSLDAFVKAHHLENRVHLIGWVPHDEMSELLNRLRLLVLPSFTEGLPNIMLEAMACGTPVLAAQVGSIPDVIRDGANGFLMEKNSAECICRNTMRALHDTDLEMVAERGKKMVIEEFNFESTSRAWQNMLRVGE